MCKCTRCNRQAALEGHHPLPRRIFGGSKRSGWRVYLCPACHKEADKLTEVIELYIHNAPAWVFKRAFETFMRGRR